MPGFHQLFPPRADGWVFCIGTGRIRALEFESANPTIVKSIKQRDLLNTWLRLYARAQSLPRMEEYQPERIEEELLSLIHISEPTRPY